jgi:hypothetical protein
MVEQKLWFSRRFNFDLEPWALPNLVERLRGTPARLEERLRGLDTATRTAKVDGKWSIQENAGHLLDLEPLWAARLDDFERGAERLSAADLQNRRTAEANHNASPVVEILASSGGSAKQSCDDSRATRASSSGRHFTLGSSSRCGSSTMCCSWPSTMTTTSRRSRRFCAGFQGFTGFQGVRALETKAPDSLKTQTLKFQSFRSAPRRKSRPRS